MSWGKETPGAEQKTTLRAAPGSSSDVKENQHSEELMGKPRNEPESVHLKIDESVGR